MTDDIKSGQNKLTKGTENEGFIPENNEKINTPPSQQTNEERMEDIDQSKKIDETGTATKPSNDLDKKKRGPLLPLPLKDTKDQDKTSPGTCWPRQSTKLGFELIIAIPCQRFNLRDFWEYEKYDAKCISRSIHDWHNEQHRPTRIIQPRAFG